MRNNFFNENGILRIDELVLESKSFKKIIEDGTVTAEEVNEQGKLVAQLFRKAEQKLDSDEKDLVVELISELCVLQAIYHKNQMDDIERGL